MLSYYPVYHFINSSSLKEFFSVCVCMCGNNFIMECNLLLMKYDEANPSMGLLWL